MQRRTAGAEFAHCAEYRDERPTLAHRFQQIKRGAHGRRIGVVGVIDEQRRTNRIDSRAHRWLRHSREAELHLFQRDAEAARHRHSEHRITQIVRAAKRYVQIAVVE